MADHSYQSVRWLFASHSMSNQHMKVQFATWCM